MKKTETTGRLYAIKEKVLCGGRITRKEATYLATLKDRLIFDLFAAANSIRDHFHGGRIDLCSIVNAKSGRCPEDCAYCAQSSRSRARITAYPLIEKKQVISRAEEAKKGGANRFCIVTSGRTVSGSELLKIADMISGVRKLGLLPCATLGLMGREDMNILKQAGLNRYHNNLETSERLFPAVCRTHSYSDKIETIRSAQAAGLSVCSGGIFGLGESWQDRIDMAFALRDLDPDSVPINFLSPIKGTAFSRQKPLDPLEALQIISLYRFILPAKQIRVCGGRLQTLGQLNSFIFLAGASGLLAGNYLTTLGRGYKEDIDLIGQLGLTIT